MDETGKQFADIEARPQHGRIIPVTQTNNNKIVRGRFVDYYSRSQKLKDYSSTAKHPFYAFGFNTDTPSIAHTRGRRAVMMTAN